jgi:peptidoglycan-N-acetylglucosamine deacetylase
LTLTESFRSQYAEFHNPGCRFVRRDSACLGMHLARAEDCPNNPDALGTSRVLDDGPVPRYSNQILDILAAQCVKATFFLVGEMAHAHPSTVRRIFAEGHTISTHSEDHPLHFGKLPSSLVEWEIDKGILDVGAALGDPNQVAPFFRIPGLARSEVVESELEARLLVDFGSDTVADDWHHSISPKKIIALAMSRLEARGKGILLLHDIHPATVAALPGLLRELKQRGFHIVQVVPASVDRDGS